MKRKLLLAGGIVLGVLIVLVVVAPFVVDAERFRSTIEDRLTDSLGRKVEIGHLSFSLLNQSLEARQVSIADDPAFSRSPFLTAGTLGVGVDVWPLLTSQELHINALALDRPQLTLLRSAAGKWNIESLGAAKPGRGDDPGSLAGFSIDHLRITNGRLVLARAGTRQAGRPFEDVNLRADHVTSDAAFPVEMQARSPGGGKVQFKGTVGPLDDKAAALAPFDAALQVDKLPAEDAQELLATLGVGLPSGSSLRGGAVKADLKLHGPLERLVTTGPLSVRNLKLAGFNLGSRLSAFAAAMGGQAGPDTSIELVSSQLRVAPEGIRSDALQIVVPVLGTLTGAGTVSPSNALDFRMVAKLNNASAAFAALGRIPGLMQGNGELPFRIQGTTSNPIFIPDMAGLSGLPKTPQQNQDQGLGGILNGLFQKKP
jgi:AsmA protein